MDLTQPRSATLPWPSEPPSAAAGVEVCKELVRYGYQQLTVATLGSCCAALVMATMAAGAGRDLRISVYLASTPEP